MEKQVRCPHCDIYTVSTQTIYNDDPSFEQRVKSRRAQATPWLGCGGLFLVFGLLGSCMLVYGKATYPSQVLTGLLLWGAIGASLLLVGWVLRAQGDMSEAVVTSVMHQCRMCGYKWEERPEQPGPAYRPVPPAALSGAGAWREEPPADEEPGPPRW